MSFLIISIPTKKKNRGGKPPKKKVFNPLPNQAIYLSLRWRGGADGGETEKLLKTAFFAFVLLPLMAFAEDGTIYETSGELWGRDSGGTLYKNTGEIWGRVTEGGTIYRTDGQIWGRVSEGGAIYRTDGEIWGRVSR